MRILHVGAGGTVGGVVGTELRGRGHEVVDALHRSGDLTVDITDPSSVRQLWEVVGGVDALVSTAGATPFGAWDELDRDATRAGFEDKFLGQVELVRQGVGYVREGGSFTLTTGVLGREPIRGGSVAAAVNGALEAWVRASAAELWGRHRVNVVSPSVLTEAPDMYTRTMPGFRPVDGCVVGQNFVRSVESFETGQVYIP